MSIRTNAAEMTRAEAKAILQPWALCFHHDCEHAEAQIDTLIAQLREGAVREARKDQTIAHLGAALEVSEGTVARQAQRIRELEAALDEERTTQRRRWLPRWGW